MGKAEMFESVRTPDDYKLGASDYPRTLPPGEAFAGRNGGAVGEAISYELTPEDNAALRELLRKWQEAKAARDQGATQEMMDEVNDLLDEKIDEDDMRVLVEQEYGARTDSNTHKADASNDGAMGEEPDEERPFDESDPLRQSVRKSALAIVRPHGNPYAKQLDRQREDRAGGRKPRLKDERKAG